MEREKEEVEERVAVMEKERGGVWGEVEEVVRSALHLSPLTKEEYLTLRGGRGRRGGGGGGGGRGGGGGGGGGEGGGEDGEEEEEEGVREGVGGRECELTNYIKVIP